MTFARIGIFEAPADRLPEVVGLFRDRVTPAFAAHGGFLGYQAFTEVDAGRYVGISYWTSLEALEASSSTARDAREAAAGLGARTIGEPIIAGEQFDTRTGSGIDPAA